MSEQGLEFDCHELKRAHIAENFVECVYPPYIANYASRSDSSVYDYKFDVASFLGVAYLCTYTAQ